jgi:hypothetical protein
MLQVDKFAFVYGDCLHHIVHLLAHIRIGIGKAQGDRAELFLDRDKGV